MFKLRVGVKTVERDKEKVHRVSLSMEGDVSPAARADYQWKCARPRAQTERSASGGVPLAQRTRVTPGRRRKRAMAPEDKFGANRN